MKNKKITAIILSIVLVLGTFGICAYAENENPFYLVLGDSIAYGSGITNSREACYGKIVADTNGNSKPPAKPGAYYLQLRINLCPDRYALSLYCFFAVKESAVNITVIRISDI